MPAKEILGEPGKGVRYAQVWLAPAQLTHCMRWLGVAQRVSGENVVERIFKDARGFRIYDGPNEVHRMSLARKILARETEELKR